MYFFLTETNKCKDVKKQEKVEKDTRISDIVFVKIKWITITNDSTKKKETKN